MACPARGGFAGGVVAGVVAGAMLFAPWSAVGGALAAAPGSNWQVDITQFDKAGTLAGTPQSLTCPQSGCQQLITLGVAGKPRRFLLSVTITARGAYVGLQAEDREVGQVVEFEKGFVGPVFMATHTGLRTSVTLRFTLTGAAVSDPERDKLMQRNSGSLVFHRKMEPDIAMRVDLSPPELAAPEGGVVPGG